MKDLGRWQFISFLSRGMAMALGIIQSFVIIRILSVQEWGLIQLAVSIGGALGIYQHLGLASASTREISGAKKPEDVFKIFVTSISIRYLITLPIVFGLYFFSDKIANDLYKSPEISFPLKLYAAALFFQGFQSILNSVISGMQRFKQLFIYQVAISVVSILLYIPLVYLFKIPGYFYAFFAFNVLNTLFLIFVALIPLRGKMHLPSGKDYKLLFKDIFSISIGIYVVKIIYTNWEKLGGTLLGLNNSAEIVGIYAFAALFAKKILSISDAVTDVNLPVLSEKYQSDIEDFKRTFKYNFDKVFALIILSAAIATYWSKELITLVVGSDKYNGSLDLVPVLVLAFVIYSVLNIVNSSVLIPVKMTKQMIFSFLFMLIMSVGSYFLLTFKLNSINSMAWAVTIGALSCLVVMLYFISRKVSFVFFNHDHVLLLIQLYFIGWSGAYVSGIVKLGAFIVLMGLLIYALLVSKLITKSELISAKNKVVNKLSGRK
ncbi:oligosaccharide flippase family protein [candidate division WWE3 bacterium]|uniref:Oligosaccharide flippase family protein n=1 Tax=candidate division WWE3 bacterium TaxID=2053526 RepID=A0A7X9DKB4_UNCKA|nr:oligosaccharide flippase family protein [candidate division WWE3 bacterium]